MEWALVAYAVICYVLGIITVKAGVLSIPASVTIITVLSLGCLIIFPFVKTQKSAQTSSDSKSLANPLLFFRKYRRSRIAISTRKRKKSVHIEFRKVKGHSNDKYNDMVDELAKEALGIH